MISTKQILLPVVVIALSLSISNATENHFPKHINDAGLAKTAGCAAATAQVDLDINNVRTTILNGGDMWWNLSNARYEVPKIQSGQISKHSLAAGSIWVGGISNGNLKLAAQTYRQNGNDYYPGPLTNVTMSVTQQRCKDFDKIWKITLNEIETFRNNPNNWANPSDVIATWPAIGNVAAGEAQYLAPFVDLNGNGFYDPTQGDYPAFDYNNSRNIPDMMLYWIYNDRGNIHSESQAVPIGIELQAQAFAYATNDEINNTTFYRTTIINRSNETLSECLIGQWTDPDLGNYSDDYVEYDVNRNLAICYNGDNNDEGILGYGVNPPAVGIKFLEGPVMNGSLANMATFICYDDNNLINGTPTLPEHYFSYLNGRWKNGILMSYGGTGVGGTDTCHYIFPGSTDPLGRPAWTEITAASTPGNRHFLQASAPFEFLPGAVNRVTIAVVWARASSGGPTGAFQQLRTASDKAQLLFSNNFSNILTPGPEAPMLSITAKDKKLEFTISDYNQTENYADSFFVMGQCGTRTSYRFQGYQVFQLKNASIPLDFADLDNSRLVAQFDIADSIKLLVNTIYDPALEDYVMKPMVNGKDKGIQYSFTIDKDKFGTTSDSMENLKEYHYAIVAYANAIGCPTAHLQYISSRKTVGRSSLLVYTAFPLDSTYTGLKNPEGTASNILVYPNPGNSRLEFHHLPSNADHVTFYTISGKKCSTELLKNSNTVETDSWDTGIYLYRIEDKNGKTLKTGKWMKL